MIWRLTRMEMVFVANLALSLLVVTLFGERLVAWDAAVVIALLSMLMLFLGLSLLGYVFGTLWALRTAGFHINIRLQWDYVVGTILSFLPPLVTLFIMLASVHFTWDTPLGTWLMRIGISLLPPSAIVQILVFAGARMLKRELERVAGGTNG